MNNQLSLFCGRNTKNNNTQVATLTHYIVTVIVQHKLATLWEIDEKYDMWQILQLYEMAIYETINKCIVFNERG